MLQNSEAAHDDAEDVAKLSWHIHSNLKIVFSGVVDLRKRKHD